MWEKSKSSLFGRAALFGVGASGFVRGSEPVETPPCGVSGFWSRGPAGPCHFLFFLGQLPLGCSLLSQIWHTCAMLHGFVLQTWPLL